MSSGELASRQAGQLQPKDVPTVCALYHCMGTACSGSPAGSSTTSPAVALAARPSKE